MADTSPLPAPSSINPPKTASLLLKRLPASLKEAMDALEKDHKFLLEDGVFDEKTIQTWIAYKIDKEYNAVRNRPHPYEISLYYDM